MLKIHRSQMKNAPYNPRVMSADARKRLRAGVKKLGMLGPITWNERSGNVVGGHQRLEIYDAVHKKDKEADYELSVAAVDLDDNQEREANLLLNNAAAMGDFDMVKLEALVHTTGLDIEATGWTEADVFRLFGSGVQPPPSVTTASEAVSHVEKALERIMEMKAATEDSKTRAVERDREDFYLVVVFKSYKDRLAWTEARGLDDNRYQASDAFMAPGEGTASTGEGDAGEDEDEAGDDDDEGDDQAAAAPA